jgi:hypothetical protein
MALSTTEMTTTDSDAAHENHTELQLPTYSEQDLSSAPSIEKTEGPAPEQEIQQDGGFTAWLQVFACWLLFMNTWCAS